ncbi:hypothetical protein RI845_15955 [Thalassotalea nanhaiensis]|uniref:Uncharacterized protein n=1 Tax=Thalassotalea nanhaiensis TaxID=3065648 RepID=A0ABY9TH01_9GAMM|nr:hypothetical protein RI845_15955 [Colwelliaceae bacterium SQ345]
MRNTKIPIDLIKRDGPFAEFKQDAALVTVELLSGIEFSGVLLLYPNTIIAVEDYSELPFNPEHVIRIHQSSADLINRSSSDWVFWND